MDQLKNRLETNGRISKVSVPSVSPTADTDAVYEDKIKKLARLTQRRVIEWYAVEASTIPTLSFAKVLTAYEAGFDGEKLRLTETGYEKQRPLTRLDPFVGHGGLASLAPFARTNELQDIVLSLHLLDLNGQPTFKFPHVEAIYDLFNEVKKQQSDIDRFLRAIDAAAATTEEQHNQTDK